MFFIRNRLLRICSLLLIMQMVLSHVTVFSNKISLNSSVLAATETVEEELNSNVTDFGEIGSVHIQENSSIQIYFYLDENIRKLEKFIKFSISELPEEDFEFVEVWIINDAENWARSIPLMDGNGNCVSSKNLEQNKEYYAIDRVGYIQLVTMDDIQESQNHEWEEVSEMPESRYSVASAYADNKIYIFGGIDNGIISNKVEVYDIANNQWTTDLSVMPEASYGQTAGVIGNNIYLMSGYNEYDAQKIIQVYDIGNDEWTILDTPNINSEYASCVFNDELYIIGGKTDDLESNDVYKYNPVDNKWSAVASIPMTGENMKAVCYDNSILVLNDSEKNIQMLCDGVWSNYGELTEEKISNYAVTNITIPFLNDSEYKEEAIYMLGGEDSDGHILSSSVAYYSPNFNKKYWLKNIDLPSSLKNHTVVSDEQYLYVIGGISDEEYNIVENKIYRLKKELLVDDFSYDTDNIINFDEQNSFVSNYIWDTDSFYFDAPYTGEFKVKFTDEEDISLYHGELYEDGILVQVAHDIKDSLYMQKGKEYRFDVRAFNNKIGGECQFELTYCEETINYEKAVPIEIDTVIPGNITRGEYDLYEVDFDEDKDVVCNYLCWKKTVYAEKYIMNRMNW